MVLFAIPVMYAPSAAAPCNEDARSRSEAMPVRIAAGRETKQTRARWRRLAGRIAYFGNEWFIRNRHGEPAIHRAPAPPAPAGLAGLRIASYAAHVSGPSADVVVFMNTGT